MAWLWVYFLVTRGSAKVVKPTCSRSLRRGLLGSFRAGRRGSSPSGAIAITITIAVAIVAIAVAVSLTGFDHAVTRLDLVAHFREKESRKENERKESSGRVSQPS